MPWRETSPMDQKTQFIGDYLRESLSITELCELYRISRKSGYKWIDRYLREGPAGLDERSRNRAARPIKPLSTSWPRFFRRASAIPPGAERNCWRSCKNVTPIGLGLHGPPSAISSAATAWFPSNDNADVSVTPVNPPPPSWPQTMCGRRISRAISKPATASTVIPLPSLTAIAGICSVARGCPPPLWLALSRCSPACSKNSAYPNAFAPTTVCPSQPTPWRGCLRSRRGGSVWVSCPNSSNQGNPNKMGGTSECIAPSKPKPLDPRRPIVALNNANSTTSARSLTLNDPMRRWTCKHPLPFTNAHPERCPRN